MIRGQITAHAGGEPFERAFECRVVLDAPQPADLIKQVAGQNLLEPGQQFGFAPIIQGPPLDASCWLAGKNVGSDYCRYAISTKARLTLMEGDSIP